MTPAPCPTNTQRSTIAHSLRQFTTEQHELIKTTICWLVNEDCIITVHQLYISIGMLPGLVGYYFISFYAILHPSIHPSLHSQKISANNVRAIQRILCDTNAWHCFLKKAGFKQHLITRQPSHQHHCTTLARTYARSLQCFVYTPIKRCHVVKISAWASSECGTGLHGRWDTRSLRSCYPCITVGALVCLVVRSLSDRRPS